jgi:hypothetical protein
MKHREFEKPIIGYFGVGVFVIGFWIFASAILYSICSGIYYLINGKFLNWVINDVLRFVNWDIPQFSYYEITGLVGLDNLLRNYIFFGNFFAVLGWIGVIFIIIGFIFMIISIKP